MPVLRPHTLRHLIDGQKDPCLSVQLPCHARGQEAARDRVRLKALLKEAETRLLDDGVDSRACTKLLAPARELLADEDGWAKDAHGLAIFASSETFRAWWVPVELEEQLVVAKAFHIKPLLPLLSGDGRFYILAISKKSARLYQASRFTMSEIDLSDLAASFAESFRFDVFEKSLQHHTASTGGQGRPGAIYHGHGGAGHDHSLERKLQEHLQHLDGGVRKLLDDHNAPLVLAGVRRICAAYRQASHYPHLLAAGIHGNPDHMTENELHDRALALVEEELDARRRKAADSFANLSRSQRASTRIEQVVQDAYRGRVERLFVALDREVWGRFVASFDAVVPHEEREAGDDDLLNVAALYTLYHGGEVYAVPAEDMPAVSPCAAVFRY